MMYRSITSELTTLHPGSRGQIQRQQIKSPSTGRDQSHGGDGMALMTQGPRYRDTRTEQEALY